MKLAPGLCTQELFSLYKNYGGVCQIHMAMTHGTSSINYYGYVICSVELSRTVLDYYELWGTIHNC
jgi:hypothetical protein